MAVTTSAVLAGAAAASQLAGSGMSFASARKQKRAQAQAEKEADIAMASARQSLEKNYMDSLAIQKEPYELERDAALVAGAQATEALRESERGAGRVGAIYGQQQQAQRQIASAMGQEMFNLDYLSAQEDTRLRDIGTQLDLGEVTGAQLAAANAEERRQQQLQAGVAGIGGAAMTGLDAVALYGKTKPTPSSASGGTDMSKLVSQADLGLGKSVKGLQPTNAQSLVYSTTPTIPPQSPKSSREAIMATQQANQSRNTPIGNEPINYIKPPGINRFLSSLNPFKVN
jgi:hypothetical protein